MKLGQRHRSHFPLQRAPTKPVEEYDVIFILPHMGRGGTQRVASLVANWWSAEGRRVCILSLLDGQGVAHRLHPMVCQVRLTEFAAASARITRIRTYHLKSIASVICGGRDTWLFRLGARIVDGLGRFWQVALSPVRKLLRICVKLLRACTRSCLSAALVLLGSAKRNKMGMNAHAQGFVHDLYWRGIWAAFSWAQGGTLNQLEMFLKSHPASVVVSFLSKTNVLTLLAARGLPCRVVVSERNDLHLQALKQPWRVLRQLTYCQADLVTANAVGVLQNLQKFVPEQRLRVLPNPAVAPSEPSSRMHRKPVFVSVARLVHQKGIDLLIEAFSLIEQRLPDWSLSIIGDGPEREALERKVKALGLAGRVTFFGHVSPPFEHLWSSRVFVLPSRFEGMPNALLEAMGCGLAPIVTDASPGPRECVIHEETGLVVQSENVRALASAMLRLGTDVELTGRLGCAAQKALESRSWAAVEADWLDILNLVEKMPEQRSA